MKKSDERFLNELKNYLLSKRVSTIYDINLEDKKFNDKACFVKHIDNKKHSFNCEVNSLFRMRDMYNEQLLDPLMEIADIINHNLTKKLN